MAHGDQGYAQLQHLGGDAHLRHSAGSGRQRQRRQRHLRDQAEQGREGERKHDRHRPGERRDAHEAWRGAEEGTREATAEGTADQQLTAIDDPGRQRRQRHAGQRRQRHAEQRPEHPRIGDAQQLERPHPEQARAHQQREVLRVHIPRQGHVDVAALHPGEGEREGQHRHHHHDPDGVRRGDAVHRTAVAIGEVGHFRGPARQGGEERGWRIHAPQPQQNEGVGHAEHQRAQRGRDHQRRMQAQLRHHLRTEVQPERGADRPLSRLPSTGERAQVPVGHACAGHGEQRADHPRQRQVQAFGQPAGERGERERGKDLAPGGETERGEGGHRQEIGERSGRNGERAAGDAPRSGTTLRGGGGEDRGSGRPGGPHSETGRVAASHWRRKACFLAWSW